MPRPADAEVAPEVRRDALVNCITATSPAVRVAAARSFKRNGSPGPASRGRVIHGIVAADAPREEIRRMRDRRAA
jgi:hypothetical protein